MADSRSHPSVLEQFRRHWRGLALTAGFVALAGGAGLLFRPARSIDSPVQPIAPLPKGRVQVEVLNGTQRQGAARTATRMLRSHGLDVVFLGNADSLVDSTRIMVRRGDPSRAGYIVAALGGGKVVVQTDTFRRVDVSVILGEDFKPRLDVHP
jgi:hypothetical protein